MIPKILHCCWFGKNKMPKSAIKCIESFRKFCPDYSFNLINEDNFDFESIPYAKEAYEAKKFAFVSDIARLDAVYKNGGIYFDTDVELLKPLDPLLNCKAYFGFEHTCKVSTGLGFGAEANSPIVGALLDDYSDKHFLLPDGSLDTLPCPDRNLEVFKRFGMIPNDMLQEHDGILFLPHEYLCPRNYFTGRTKITENTVSIHHYAESWTSKTSKRTTRLKRLIGVRAYDCLYAKFLHRFKGFEW